MRILFLIPARGGSKGIPNKNIINLLSKPLIGYTIEECLHISKFYNCEICVSTDSNDIKKVAENFGLKVPFVRPEHLSNDTASSESVILHALDWYQSNGINFDFVVLLQPTSPLRKYNHILDAINLYLENQKNNIDMMVSVKISKANPYFNLFEENNNGMLTKSIKSSYTRRQDCPITYEYNGAIYVININSLREKGILNFDKIKKYVMDEISSLDIDEPNDLIFCENLISILKKKENIFENK
jgi:CMP-N,N'-diacetyllegionaminic acid synthase